MKRGRGEGEQQVTDTGSKDRLMGPEGMCKEPGGFQQKNLDQFSENMSSRELYPYKLNYPKLKCMERFTDTKYKDD